MINAKNFIPNPLNRRLPLSEIWAIFKKMFVLLREQETLWTPIVRMVFVNIIILFLFVIGAFELAQDHFTMGLTLLIISAAGYLLRNFYYGYLFGILSAMVLLYLHGNEVSLKNARHLVRHRILSLGFLHVLSNCLSVFFKRRRFSDRPSAFARLFFDSISLEALDLFGHFLVPVIVLENVSLTKSLLYLDEVRNHLPASLSGIFGVDMTKTFLSFLLIPFSLAIIILCVFLGMHGLNFYPNITLIYWDNFTFSWLPLLIGILLITFVMSFLRPWMDGLKVIYFTLLYTLIRHPEKIQPAKRAQFTSLLDNQ